MMIHQRTAINNKMAVINGNDRQTFFKHQVRRLAVGEEVDHPIQFGDNNGANSNTALMVLLPYWIHRYTWFN